MPKPPPINSSIPSTTDVDRNKATGRSSSGSDDFAMATSQTVAVREVLIEPPKRWRLLNWREVVEYRDLLRYLVWRDIRVRYAQSAVGIGWAVIQPLFSMLIFTLIFGKLAKLSSDGSPYALFSLTALVPWMFFANAVGDGVKSLVSNAQMLRKVYFPRVLLPVSAVLARLLDFAIAFLVLIGLMLIYGQLPTMGILAIPLAVMTMVLAATGLSLWLSALAIQYRDVNHAMGFILQLLMYAAPVIYATSIVPAAWQPLYAAHPMVGVIETMRAALLDTRQLPWGFLAIGFVSSIGILSSGIAYFRSRERMFADVA